MSDLVSGDEEKVKEIWETAKIARGYFHLKSMIAIGLSVKIDEIPFEKLMVYSWIEESKNGRKN